MEIIHNWATWKKNNNPTIYGSKDLSLGYISTIEPTLKSAGFIHYDSRDFDKEAPLSVALEMFPKNEFIKEAVYYVYRHPRGYFKRVELYIKKFPKG